MYNRTFNYMKNTCVLSSFSKRFKIIDLNRRIESKLFDIKNFGLYKSERIISSPQSSSISLSHHKDKVLNFCSNNYLGLANDKMLIESAKKTLDTHGFGLSSVRFICGTQDIHKELEKKIANFHGTEDAILYASCYDANAGIFEALLGKDDVIISDELNHASIIDGVRLSKAARFRYKHMDIKDLEKKLIRSKKFKIKIIVTDGVFSMDGDIAPLKSIVNLADKYNATVMIDECHATGFFGKTGRGTPEYYNVKADIINSTLGKALGGATGGYTASSNIICDMLRQKSRPYLFSNSLAPCIVGASIKMFDLLSKSSELCEILSKNVKKFREEMKTLGFNIAGASDHPIVPLMLGDAKLASDFADEMLKEGIYVIGFSYPVVPKGKARIRIQISANHSEKDIERAIKAFKNVGEKLKVI